MSTHTCAYSTQSHTLIHSHIFAHGREHAYTDTWNVCKTHNHFKLIAPLYNLPHEGVMSSSVYTVQVQILG